MLLNRKVIVMSEAEILVSGATGRTGGAAVDELLKMGKRVRAYVRSDGEKAAALRARGVDIAVGDFTDSIALSFAAAGVQAIYHICPNMSRDEVVYARAVAAAAKARGRFASRSFTLFFFSDSSGSLSRVYS